MDVPAESTTVNLELSNKELQNLLDKAKDWALMHGISMRYANSYNQDTVTIAPFTLLPSYFPREAYEKAKNGQRLFNELIHKVAYDHEFLKESLSKTIDADTFTAKLFHVYEKVFEEGFNQNISLGLLRADYMLHQEEELIPKQIEINTIASSFGGLSTAVSQYHRYIFTELGYSNSKCQNHLPENNAITGLCSGLVDAWELYNDPQAVILFVVEDVTYNICDQRFHEHGIVRLNPSIRTIRRSLKDLVSQATLGSHKELLVEDFKVGVVYFRSGYQEEVYSSDLEWTTRLLIERSRAIKCPSIQYHLAGTKKIQQSLAQPGVLSRFFKDETSIKTIQEFFVGLYALEFNEVGNEAVEKAIREPKKFVLKPQREGGANNIYNEDVKTHLTATKDSKEREKWILMDRIFPPTRKNYLIRPGISDILDFKPKDVVSELGIYGVVIGDEGKIFHNETIGHLLRTKEAASDESGVAAGFGVLDSPYLYP